MRHHPCIKVGRKKLTRARTDDCRTDVETVTFTRGDPARLGSDKLLDEFQEFVSVEGLLKISLD